MKIIIYNRSWVLRICLNLLRWTGFLVPEELTGFYKVLGIIYLIFWVTFIVGFIISQTIALIQGWGDVSTMTGIAFLLFTNCAFAIKLFNVKSKRQAVQAIVDDGDYVLSTEDREEGQCIITKMNKETIRFLILYMIDASVTLFGWLASAEEHELPFRAWYPYDTSKVPAFQLTFLFQLAGVIFVASMNVSLDQVVTTLTAVCRCRLQLLNLSLRTLCRGIIITDKLLSPEEEKVVKSRAHECILQHQAALHSAAQIQECFTTPILTQFTVSSVIICVTAYQLAEETNENNLLWLISMIAYFLGMVMQVYFYCNEAHKLSEESLLVADAVYECPWYVSSISLRRSLLVMMLRSRRVTVITAGGFATLSLSCFVSIIRASYSFFTVLNQMDN